MNIKTLGIFDSGLGGYSVYRDLKDKGPKIEYVLYADQANAPYGNKEPEEIYGFSKQAMEWFQAQGIYHVLLACNTVSALSLEKLTEDFPAMTIWGIIDLTLNQIQDKDAHLTVLSTKATYASHAYQKTWDKPENVVELPLSDLVAMIEEGAPNSEMDHYLKSELGVLKTQDILILACTHFPLVFELFEKYFSGTILDSRKPILKLVESIATNNDQASSIYTSGKPEILKEQIKNLFNIDEEVRRV